jgi:hypothetical protein
MMSDDGGFKNTEAKNIPDVLVFEVSKPPCSPLAFATRNV